MFFDKLFANCDRDDILKKLIRAFFCQSSKIENLEYKPIHSAIHDAAYCFLKRCNENHGVDISQLLYFILMKCKAQDSHLWTIEYKIFKFS